jgi:uncharacterized protein YcfJ
MTKRTIIIIAAALIISGCAGGGYAPTRTGDRVGTGAVVGGATGAIIGNQTGLGSWGGAAIGAGVGALSGLAYDSAQKERENDARYRAQRERQIYHDEYDRVSRDPRSYRPGPRTYRY